MAAPKLLKNLNIEVSELKDEAIYRCAIKNKKGEKLREELIETTGNELKMFAKNQGQKNGMIRYNKKIYYEIIEEKKKAPF